MRDACSRGAARFFALQTLLRLQLAHATVLAHYLPWYTLEASAEESRRHGWTADDGAKQYGGSAPFIGEYDQRDDATLRYHALLAAAIGIDVLLVNLNPTWQLHVDITRRLIGCVGELHAQHAGFDLRIGISYDNAAATTAAAAASNFAVVAEVLSNATARGVAFTWNTSPVIFLWSEEAVAYDALRAALPSDTLALARNAVSFGPSDGNFAWLLPRSGDTAVELAALAAAEPPDAAWGVQYLRDTEWAMANSQSSVTAAERNTLYVGSAYPGFDDAHVPASWNGGHTRRLAYNTSRGTTYELSWEHALGFTPRRYGGTLDVMMPMMQLVTWNDYPEGTAIEPRAPPAAAEANAPHGVGPGGGFAAFEATRGFIRRFRGEPPTHADDEPIAEAVRAAAAIFAARRQGRTDTTAAESLLLSGAFGAAARRVPESDSYDPYKVSGSTILYDDTPWVPVGVNAMHSYGSASGITYPPMSAIAREYVIMSKQPLACHASGCWASQLSTGSWLHPLEALLRQNNDSGLTTIIDLHRWNESDETQFWAKIPSHTPFYEEYLRMLTDVYVPFCREWSHVCWLSVWNEPFMWDGSDGVDATQWASEMGAILSAVRGTGYAGVIVVPGGRMGQDEGVVITAGAALAAAYAPIVYDIHAYERWTGGTREQIHTRLAALQSAGVAVIFGEVGPLNAGQTTDPWPFLEEAATAGMGLCGWVWKCASSAADRNAMQLCDGSGLLNDRDNFNWGTGFAAYIVDAAKRQLQRRPSPPAPPPYPPGVVVPYRASTAAIAADPHITFAGGGSADFRGSHRTYYAFLSSPGYQFAPYFQEVDFWHYSATGLKQLVHGTYMTKAAWRIRTGAGDELLIKADAMKRGELEVFKIAKGGIGFGLLGSAPVTTTLAPRSTLTLLGGTVHLTTQLLTVSVATPEWQVNVSQRPVYNLLPPLINETHVHGHWAVDQKRLDIAIAGRHPNADAHGVVGQSYHPHYMVRDGKMDEYAHAVAPTSATSDLMLPPMATAAQAEGAIAGVYTDYEVESAWSTDFKHSMYEKRMSSAAAGPVRMVTASTTEWEGRGPPTWLKKRKREL